MALTRREAFARLFEHMCRHDGAGGHGYSQPARWGDGTTERVDLGDGVTVEVAGGDRDCSSGVVSCLRAVGVDTHGATYTGNMLDLCSGGLFRAHPRRGGRCVDGYVARRGDIYLNTGHHTAICLSADPDLLAQFSLSEHGTISGATGDQTGRESNVRPYYDYPWTHTLSWTSDGGSIGEEDEVKAEDIQAIAEAVWNFNQNGTLMRDRVQGTDEAANGARSEIFRLSTWDPETHASPLGNLVVRMPVEYPGPDGEQTTEPLGNRVGYIDQRTHAIEARQEAIEAKLDAIIEKLG